MPEKDLETELKRIEKEMLDAAKNLEFEKAAELRDRLYQAQGEAVRRRAGLTRGGAADGHAV